jgi:hypothetical protein
MEFPKIKPLSQRTEEEKALAEKNDRETHLELRKMLRLPGNNVCADCAAKFPGWAALPHGVFICIDCAQLHRHMGRHISQVKAINTGTYLWYPDEVEAMGTMGNLKANEFYLAKHASVYPPADSPLAEKEQFIRNKYEKKVWAKTADLPVHSVSQPSPPTEVLEISPPNPDDPWSIFNLPPKTHIPIGCSKPSNPTSIQGHQQSSKNEKSDFPTDNWSTFED